MTSKRVSSGISELDEMLSGGFPKGDVILYSGRPGTGKTVAAMQFIADGLSKGEDCIYVSSEETRGKVLENAQSLRFSFKKAAKEGHLEIFQVEDIAFNDPLGRRAKLPRDPEQRAERLSATIRKWMKKCEGKRLVIDSLLAYALEGHKHSQLINGEIFRQIDELGMTTILISELLDDCSLSRDGYMESLADGIVLFRRRADFGKCHRTLEVPKMRGTKVIDEIKRFEVKKGGIKFIK